MKCGTLTSPTPATRKTEIQSQIQDTLFTNAQDSQSCCHHFRSGTTVPESHITVAASSRTKWRKPSTSFNSGGLPSCAKRQNSHPMPWGTFCHCKRHGAATIKHKTLRNKGLSKACFTFNYKLSGLKILQPPLKLICTGLTRRPRLSCDLRRVVQQIEVMRVGRHAHH